MTLRLSYCGTCARFRPEIKQTITQLQREYPEQLRVVELDCMVACDEGPVAMLEYDFLTHVEPHELYTRIAERLRSQRENQSDR